MSWANGPLVVSSYTLGTRIGFPERVRVAAEAGFAGVGLRVENYRLARDAGLDDAAMLEILDRHRSSVCEVEYVTGWATDRDAAQQDLERTVFHMARTFGVRHVNAARKGRDPEFGRGTTPFNRGSGDPEHRPNPSLAPLETPPFYAIKILPGSFGAFAGLRTDPRSRVLDAAGTAIPGLWAAGSDQANVMGGHYPSGGVNIGPAMTFGFLAGCDAAGRDPAISAR